jgi:hypothetical protein
MNELLEWSLRGFGLFWIVGSALAFQKAREAALIDKLLGALSGTPEDPLVTRFLFAGSILTLVSGAGLAAGSGWALLPLGLLVVSQLLYFHLKGRAFRRAATDEAREEARVSPATRNAFVTSVGVTLLTLMAVQVGVFPW